MTRGRRSLAAAGGVLLAAGSASAQQPDFSGMWTLDREASRYAAPAFSGGRGGDDVGRLFITQAADGTLIVGAETNGLKAWSYAPGRELVIPVGRDTTMRAASRWEGGRLVAEGTQGDMTMREVMALSPDGGTLTIEVVTSTPDGETRNRLVYRADRPVGPPRPPGRRPRPPAARGGRRPGPSASASRVSSSR